ncbi:MAG: arylsulfatase [Bacteroidota bacterium]
MKTQTKLLFFLLICAICGYGQDQRPNILLIVADDLGYSDIGAYGGEIATPFLDTIAEQSILFNNFHTLPTCAPTLSVLLTGADNHLVGIGAQEGGFTKKQKGQPGYEGYLNERTVTLPEVLQTAGYRTYMSGKWHLGHHAEQAPCKRGFQETFALMPGGASHYADQKPLHPAEPVVYRRNGQVLKTLPPDFYSTKNYTDSLLLWMERDKQSEQPFFAYLAYTAPHDPLHAPEAYIKKYDGFYEEGYEVLRKKRFAQLQKRGLISPSQSLPNWPKFIPRWADLSETKKRTTIRDMQTLAAMVDYMDEQIGRVYHWLTANNQLDNTLIIFISDNGSPGLDSRKIYPTYSKTFASQFNNELTNRGLPNSFTNLYAGWSVASIAQYRDFKTYATEGGIRNPMLIKAPRAFNTQKNICTTMTHVSDLMPTILEVAGAEHPSRSNTHLINMRGKSLAPILANPTLDVHQSEGIGIELHGTRAYIKDGWKILQVPIPGGSGDWDLYNLNQDPAEQNNLIFTHRSKFKELHTAYQQYEEEVGVIYDLPLVLGTIDTAFHLLFYCLIGLLLLSIFNNWNTVKASQKSPAKPLLAMLLGIEILGIIGLFTIFNPYAAYVLLATQVLRLLLLISRQARWTTYGLGLASCFLLCSFLLFKSGWLVVFLL